MGLGPRFTIRGLGYVLVAIEIHMEVKISIRSCSSVRHTRNSIQNFYLFFQINLYKTVRLYNIIIIATNASL